jgi:hypothetical protein
MQGHSCLQTYGLRAIRVSCELVRVRPISVVLVAIAALTPGGALARASAAPGPVSPALVSFINSAGTLFRLAPPRAHPRLSKRAGVTDALRQSPWRDLTATGISLIKLVRTDPAAPVGSLAWLVSFESRGEGAQTSPSADFFLVAVTASKGRFIAAAHGYVSSSPTH